MIYCVRKSEPVVLTLLPPPSSRTHSPNASIPSLQDTSCQFEDSMNHASKCTENRLTLGSTVIELEELRDAINAFVNPRHRFLAPTALRAILRPSSEGRTLDTHYLLLEFVPTQHSVQLFSASVQPLTELYAQYRNGEQQRAALMQYAQRFREQYTAAGADVAGTLFIQCRCPSVLGLSNDVTPVTIVKWLVDQTRAQPPLEPGWEAQFVARMNEKAY
ncbi:hypothetical protein FRC01_006633 [Tulasnella sp. 417]|nr:hypothetical protein FRC01_006633 [Tulasnella sp. 417]